MQAGCAITSPQIEQPAHINAKYLIQAEQGIRKTLDERRKLGNEKWSYNTTRKVLNQIARNCNIFDPDAVKNYVAEIKRTDTRKKNMIGKPIGKGFKQKLIDNYALFCQYNNIEFLDVPKYKYQPPPPTIPKTEDVEAIIMHSAKEFMPIFRVMTETAAEGQELHNIHIDEINQNSPHTTLKVMGVKQHDNGTYTLSEETSNILREMIRFRVNNRTKHHLLTEMDKDPTIYPFPTPKTMGEAWRSARKRAAKRLCKPHLDTIELKSLRNFAGAIFYTTMGKDPIATKAFMRHKKLEQTMHYLQQLNSFTTNNTKIGKLVSTAEEAMELILQGFTEEAVYNQGTASEKHILTKIKY